MQESAEMCSDGNRHLDRHIYLHSTGGKQIDAQGAGEMTIVNVEMSYKTATTMFLEQVSCTVDDIAWVSRQLVDRAIVEEVVILSTCNRTEIFAWQEGPAASADEIVEHFLELKDVTEVEPKTSSLVAMRTGEDAVEHLFSVACGLESMALGEDQIVAQIRAALHVAREGGSLGPHLAWVFSSALKTSKRARSETEISSAGPTLVAGFLEIVANHHGSHQGKKAVLIGSGTIGNLAARHLTQVGAQLFVVSRRYENAVHLTEVVGTGEAVPVQRLHELLEIADIVVCSTASRDTVLSASDLAVPRSRSGHTPLSIADLALPRDVDPSCEAIEGVQVFDLARIGDHLRAGGNHEAVAQVRGIVEEETAATVAREQAKVADPLILALRNRIRGDAKHELDRLFKRMPGIAPEHREATEAALYRLVGKFLHAPTVQTKKLCAAVNGHDYLHMLIQIFDLDDGTIPHDQSQCAHGNHHHWTVDVGDRNIKRTTTGPRRRDDTEDGLAPVAV